MSPGAENERTENLRNSSVLEQGGFYLGEGKPRAQNKKEKGKGP